MPDGSEQPISFASRVLSKSGRIIPKSKKKDLQSFSESESLINVYGRHFLIQTHHKPLLELLSEKKGIPTMTLTRIQQWDIFLSAYHYSLSYRTGSKNANADFVS